MDLYTEKTKYWLEERFKRTNESGIYFAHQPIYGFRKGHSGDWVINSYTITYQILKALSCIEFDSLLDVGGAEGYTAALVKNVFNVNVTSCDLSSEACNRAKEIFGVNGKAVDIHKLPFEDNEFDVVVCSETIEHVPDFRLATNELLRVCKKAVVLTVPHESEAVIENNIKEKIPHAHIHCFDEDSFDFTKQVVEKITAKKMLDTRLNIPRAIVEAKKRTENETDYSSTFVRIYNFLRPAFGLLFGKKSVEFLMKADEHLSKNTNNYSGLIFVLLKDKNFAYEIPRINVSPEQIVNFVVPYHYLRK
ncbi:MAG: methylase involved in ubiquinone/menaquinone biosynthesi [Stygiobacter sp.]|nr:MAG: methylase involved in ubiquinone/menaquinone biosynthesi [Stygiobacter sp.]KAF0214576.1 MAG: methylase involved in ubiquinone/menaquinone [Ignavibacteria bacterium]